ncbi:MAG: RusA family crossover junction endodeoxyribonuclease [Syntrophorhabdaceae bacterium]|nr:RusA family crossover junction endodeoxyribonuclease [Syntrophorhabdaceae bacterium]
MIQQFLIFGDPRPQGRPRFFKRGNFVGVYDPKKSREYKQTLAAQIAAQKPRYIADGAICLELEFIFARPKSLPKRIYDHTKKPDLDNLIKAFLDSATGVIWRDDTQIVCIMARKDYGDVPCIKVKVRDGVNNGNNKGI